MMTARSEDEDTKPNLVEKPNRTTNPLSFKNLYQKVLKEHTRARTETNLDALTLGLTITGS
jgi:hypothetical protein